MKTLSIAGIGVLLALAGATASAKEEPKKDPPSEVTVEVKLAREVEDRKPVDAGTSFDAGKLYCWNLLQGGKGDYVVTHLWQRDGKQVWKRSVRARGQKWVTWSYYNVTPGKWKVEVLDEGGRVLGASEFVVK